MDTEDVAAAADPATDDNGEAEVAHGEAELKEAADAAKEEELDPIGARAPRRRGGCGRLLRCCFILVMPALAVLANLFLHRPNPQHFASFRSSEPRGTEELPEELLLNRSAAEPNRRQARQLLCDMQ